jgi:hypothetical protein
MASEREIMSSSLSSRGLHGCSWLILDGLQKLGKVCDRVGGNLGKLRKDICRERLWKVGEELKRGILETWQLKE